MGKCHEMRVLNFFTTVDSSSAIMSKAAAEADIS
jgi:hypothetical protein